MTRPYGTLRKQPTAWQAYVNKEGRYYTGYVGYINGWGHEGFVETLVPALHLSLKPVGMSRGRSSVTMKWETPEGHEYLSGPSEKAFGADCASPEQSTKK